MSLALCVLSHLAIPIPHLPGHWSLDHIIYYSTSTTPCVCTRVFIPSLEIITACNLSGKHYGSGWKCLYFLPHLQGCLLGIRSASSCILIGWKGRLCHNLWRAVHLHFLKEVRLAHICWLAVLLHLFGKLNLSIAMWSDELVCTMTLYCLYGIMRFADYSHG